MNSAENQSSHKQRAVSFFSAQVVSFVRNTLATLDKNPWKWIFRLGITTLFVVIVNKHVDFRQLLALLHTAKFSILCMVLLAGIAALFFQVVRWQMILRFHNLPATFPVAGKTMFRGFLLAFVTPGRVGELFRAIDLDPSRKMDSVLSVFEERFCAVAITIFAGLIALLYQMLLLGKEPFLPLFTALALAVVCPSILLLLIKLKCLSFTPANRLLNRFAWLPAYLSRLRTLPVLPILAYSLIAHMLLLLQTALLFTMFGHYPFLDAVIAAAQAYSFMLLLPFFIANIGLREYSFSLFLAPFIHQSNTSVLPAVALGTATIILLCNIMLPAAAGLVWMYFGRKTVHHKK